MCEEYTGPLRKYKELGIEELHLPTTDHFEPELEDLMVRSETRIFHLFLGVSPVDPPNSFAPIIQTLSCRVPLHSFVDTRRKESVSTCTAVLGMGVVRQRFLVG
mmetsp:Transcript_11864/g.28405  ORF Transcript_11864/g.28405 Transcript_11864/m.28405 type:complete len:104 (+) Transcript_11864:1804-2115(+)